MTPRSTVVLIPREESLARLGWCPEEGDHVWVEEHRVERFFAGVCLNVDSDLSQCAVRVEGGMRVALQVGLRGARHHWPGFVVGLVSLPRVYPRLR